MGCVLMSDQCCKVRCGSAYAGSNVVSLLSGALAPGVSEEEV